MAISFSTPILRRVYSRYCKSPHIEHLATINPVVSPSGWKSNIALARCGEMIHHFEIADNVSRQYTDGTTFLVPCPGCYPEGVE